jgi:hypothetical protein
MGPRWKGDGKEVYYRASDDKMMAVDVTVAGTAYQVGAGKPLFQAPVAAPKIQPTYIHFYWDVAADGKRFFMPAPAGESSPEPFTVVLNWTSLLKK